MENRGGEEGKPIRKLVRVWIERGRGRKRGFSRGFTTSMTSITRKHDDYRVSITLAMNLRAQGRKVEKEGSKWVDSCRASCNVQYVPWIRGKGGEKNNKD